MEVSIKEINKLPDLPGVYIIRDKKQEVLYIGKANSIIKRIKNHISQLKIDSKENSIFKKAEKIEYLITSSETKALLLEYKLIKEIFPYFNVNYRDGKTYPYIKLTIKEKYPRVSISREKHDSNSLYLGPFPNVKKLKEALKTLRSIFPFRTCKRIPKKGCLYYHLQLCPAPCIRRVDSKKYLQNIVALAKVLSGKIEDIIFNLTKKMNELVKNAKFEEAAKLRDKVQALGKISSIFIEDLSLNVLKNLKKKLNLTVIPRIIDAIDISNISGKYATGSVIRFKDNFPEKNFYRRFKIKMESKINDYAMISEVVRRRYKRAITESEPLPDLILIDGGKGQLSSAKKALKELNLSINIIAFAKGKEIVYSASKKQGVKFADGSGEKILLEKMRNEAHRFAISYHLKLRRKRAKESILDEISGVGHITKMKLLHAFSSIDELKKTEPEEISRRTGISEKLSRKILEYLS
jgi:excinuclease ABC subunit C